MHQEPGLLQFVHAIRKRHTKKIRNIDYSIFVSIFTFVPSKIKTLYGKFKPFR
jgi:hypothetical protein